MSVRAKLIIIVLFVAVVPVSISAYTMLRVHKDSFGEKLTELHQKTAELGAAHSKSTLDNGLKVLENLIRDRVDWAALSEREQTQVLWLIYEQLGNIVAVSLLDEGGRGIGPSVYRAESESAVSLADRQIVSNDELRDYGGKLPLEAALRDGHAIGPALPPTTERSAIVPLAFSVKGANDARWYVGVGLSLSEVCTRLADERAPDTEIALVDSAGVPLCSSSSVVGPKLKNHLPVTAASTLRYRDSRSRDVLAAVAPAGADWTVITTQTASSAFAPRRRIQRQILFWIVLGILGALVAGVFLARGITKPIATLSRATSEVAAGKYDFELPVDGGDEFAELSKAFNTMCHEIRRWNAELTSRVDERTRALTEAQEQLLHSKKIAAVASMSAGIAHEINNPLTAVITFAQVLEARAKKTPGQEKQAEILGKLGDSALRIRDIILRMQRLSEESSQGMTDQFPANLAKAATEAMRSRLQESKIDLIFECEPDLPSVYVHGTQLNDAFVHILDNSIKAMRGDERVLTFSVKRMGDSLIQFEISDTGTGIPAGAVDKIFEPFFTLKDHWHGRGLGLAEAYQIITANHGNIKVRSTVGKGTTMVLTFPVAAKRSHLV